MKHLARLAPFVVGSLLLPSVAFAAWGLAVDSNGNWVLSIGDGTSVGFCGASTVCAVAAQFLFIINYVLVPLLFAVAFIIFLFGVAKAYIFSGGDPEEVKRGHSLVLWGILAFVIMISLWGLVNVVSNTLGLAGVPAPPPPTSY